MTFLLVSTIFFMLSSATAEYVDNSNGHVVFEATIAFDISHFRQRDTSASKGAMPDEIQIDVACLDQSQDTELDVDAIKWTPTDSWYLATGMVDDTTATLISAYSAEQAFATCYTIVNLRNKYNRMRSKERRA